MSKSGKVIRVEVTVAPRGRQGSLSEVIEIDVAELAGKSPEERESVIHGYAEEAANELAPWGWGELPGEHDPEES